MLNKIISLLFCSVLLVGMCAQEAADRGYIVKVGEQAPDFRLQTADGATVMLSDLRGKVVMLQFTASWCKVCHKEMPHIEREIWQKHKNNSRFALFGIDYKESEAAIADFVKTTGVTYPIVMDKNGSIFELYARPDAGITRNVVIDSTGKIVFLTRLFSQSEFDEMCRMIDQLLTDFSN